VEERSEVMIQKRDLCEKNITLLGDTKRIMPLLGTYL
jgi:hypothetical protein